MYLNHYDLKNKPFSISPDPNFFWPGEKHAEALAGLQYGILENKGFVLLTGEIGTGKTLLINSLVKSINKEVIVATIPDPRLELIDFYNILANKFKMGRRFERKGDFLIHFEKFLIKANDHHKKVLLIIDEAQRLKSELLDEIRVLSNIEFETRKLINIFFVGQRELKEMLLEERNWPLKQRITYNYHLMPLVEQETAAFIEHRLKVAGATKKIFSEEAIREIHNFSKGVPRLINIICDHSLMTGYSNTLTVIDVDVINECAEELQISAAKSLPFSEQPTAVEDDPWVKEQEIIKYLQKSKPSKKPSIFQETIKYIQWFKPSEQLSILKVAVIITIIIIFGGMAISFFYNSRFEQSDNLLKQNNEIFKSEDTAKTSKSPIMIADSKGDSQDTLTDKFSTDRVEIDKNVEENIIPKEQMVKEIEEFKINFVSENDLENPSVKNVQVMPLEFEKTDEDMKETLTDKLSADKNQSENNKKGIITPKDPTFNEIEEFKQYTASKNPEVDLPRKESSEGRNLIENDFKKPTDKEVDQSSKPTGGEQFLNFSEHKFVIHFKSNSADLDSQAFEKVNKIVEFVLKNPDLGIKIEGYADSYGDYNFNKKLSQFRCNIVKSYMIAKGIVNSSITAIGFGPDRPVGDNKTREGRRKNRRVEIKIKTRSHDKLS
jgi:type II secretory pathway predicted ATPase ExeA/outer membrane protein OmpA-like peptidoglycan-associated protein